MILMMTDYDAWCIDTGAGTGIVLGTHSKILKEIIKENS